MATTRVGVYRKYHGPVPTDGQGRPLPASEWPTTRRFRWAVRWFGTDGARYSRSFSSRKEAEAFAKSKQEEVEQGGGDPPPQITLKGYRKEHKKLMTGSLAPSTLKMHLAVLDLLAAQVGEGRRVDQVSSLEIERLRAGRLAAGRRPSTVNRELRTLKRLFNLAIMRGYLEPGRNPCATVPMTKVGRKRQPYCPPAELAALCRASGDPLWRAFLVTVYTTGLRLSEALNLTWSDVEFGAGQLIVTAKEPKGLIQRWQPKDHEMRTIPVPPEAIDLLTRWQAAAPERCPYVFMDRRRWEYYRRRVAAGRWAAGQALVNNLLRRFGTVCRRAGVGPYTLHDLRRSCITNWASRLPIHVVQQLAGHSDIATTERYYLSVRAEDLQAARRLGSELLGPVVSQSDPLCDPLGHLPGFASTKKG